MSEPKNDRYIRQSGIVDQDNLAKENVLVVGVGAVGRPVCHMLAATGVPNVTLIDLDTIEEHNCTTQTWREDDCGKYKAEVAAGEMLAINSKIDVKFFNERWRPKLFKGKDVADFYKERPFTSFFNCVDSLSMRKKLFDYYSKTVNAMFDARIGGQQLQMVSVFDDESKKKYPSTIVDDKEAYEEQGCHGVPMIAFSAVAAAAFLVQQFVANVQGMPMYFNRGLVFPSSELYEM